MSQSRTSRVAIAVTWTPGRPFRNEHIGLRPCSQSESLEASHTIEWLRRDGFINRYRHFGEPHPEPYEVVATFERRVTGSAVWPGRRLSVRAVTQTGRDFRC